MAIYMQFGSIAGDATLKGFEGWINLHHFDWNVDWNITTRADLEKAARDAKRPKVDEVTVKKEVDQASVELLKHMFHLNTPEKCIIRFVRTGMPGRIYLEYVFYNTLITKLTTASVDSEDTRPIETVKLNFTEVEMSVYSTDTSNANANTKPYRLEKYSVLEKKAAPGSSHASHPPAGHHR